MIAAFWTIPVSGQPNGRLHRGTANGKWSRVVNGRPDGGIWIARTAAVVASLHCSGSGTAQERFAGSIAAGLRLASGATATQTVLASAAAVLRLGAQAEGTVPVLLPISGTAGITLHLGVSGRGMVYQVPLPAPPGRWVVEERDNRLVMEPRIDREILPDPNCRVVVEPRRDRGIALDRESRTVLLQPK